MSVKLRDLKHRLEGIGSLRAWPPVWLPGGWVAGGVFGEAGILESVGRTDDRLSLRMNHEGLEHLAGLQWDPPPLINDVLQVLQANLGKTIRDLGDLEV